MTTGVHDLGSSASRDGRQEDANIIALCGNATLIVSPTMMQDKRGSCAAQRNNRC
jgi:hypothetical protein